MPISIVENRDCVEAMKEFPDEFFDLAIPDPPYGVGDFVQEQTINKKYNRDYKCEWNFSLPQEQYFKELVRVSKKYIIWGGNYYKDFIRDGGTIVWDKCNKSPVGSSAEIATTNLFNRVVLFKYAWAGFVAAKKEDTRIHPCQKPIFLYTWLLQNWAKPGDKILDTHLGSGSSRIAAHNLGFDFWGYEIDKEYFDAQERRFNGPEIKLFNL